jgi:ABC-type dipeptide/oligopeptide/nickel transport system permease subunit
MISGAVASQFRSPWWLAAFPGIAITLTVFAANLTDDLRDKFDPNLRR